VEQVGLQADAHAVVAAMMVEDMEAGGVGRMVMMEVALAQYAETKLGPWKIVLRYGIQPNHCS
jgi:hypothetical protein